MKTAFALCVLISAEFAMAQELTEAETDAVAFVSDVTMFEGMFYSVHDYCAPLSGEVVADLAEKTWIEENKRLLAYRDAVMEELIATLAGDADTADDFRGWKQGIFAAARNNDRVYADIRGAADMHLACSKRLGEMTSESMAFKRVAPDAFSFWTRHAELSPPR
jgi:hypothetical protein